MIKTKKNARNVTKERKRQGRCFIAKLQGHVSILKREDRIMDDLISRQAAIDKADSLYRDTKNDECYMITGYNHAISDIRAILKSLPSAQPELIEKTAYIRGFEQGRTQGMIDTKAEEVAQPTADVVEVVRCKDCRHKPNGYIDDDVLRYPNFPHEESNPCPCKVYGDEWYSWIPNDDFYCSFGERAEE